MMTVKEMRDLLFAIGNENLTVKEMRAILFKIDNQGAEVTADLFNLADVEDETPSDDYDWQDDTDDRGWRTYGERMAMQSRAEM